MNYDEFDLEENLEEESPVDDGYYCSTNIVTEDELDENLNKVIDEKLLHSFYLLGKYDVKIERAYHDGLRTGVALAVSIIALLVALVALISKVATVLTLLPK